MLNAPARMAPHSLTVAALALPGTSRPRHRIITVTIRFMSLTVLGSGLFRTGSYQPVSSHTVVMLANRLFGVAPRATHMLPLATGIRRSRSPPRLSCRASSSPTRLPFACCSSATPSATNARSRAGTGAFASSCGARGRGRGAARGRRSADASGPGRRVRRTRADRVLPRARARRLCHSVLERWLSERRD